jgi:hypothetical protein
MPKEVEALRTSLDSRLSALEKALADPKQHASLESLILDLARVATQEADATARQAVVAAQKAGEKLAAAARADATAALEAEKVESAALRQVIEGAKLALKQAEAALKEERRTADAAKRELASTRQEVAAIRESLEQERAAGASHQRDLDTALAALEGERRAAADAAGANSELGRNLESVRGELAALRGEHDAVHRELDGARAELDSTRGERDAAQRDLNAARRELEEVRQDSDARTRTLSQSQADQEQAMKAAHDAARNAEARLDEANRDRHAARNEIAELERQLEVAAQAVREAEAVSRELQAAHEARDAAEVLEAARPEQIVEADADDTVVDLTSITQEEERQMEIDRRTRALELALRDAESRAELAELELDRYRRSAPAAPFEPVAAPVAQNPNEGQEQFRGLARGARRVAFKAEISIQVDGTPGKLVDLSTTGAQVLTPQAINPNRLVTVTLPMNDSAMPCKAKVMWSRLEPRSGQLWYRAGVMFTSADQPALEAFLQMHQP